MKFLVICFILTVTFFPSQAQFRLANIFGDQMVLQMEPKRAQIYGFGTVNKTVSVQLNGAAPIQAIVQPDGTWKVLLPPHAAGGPNSLTASQENLNVSISVWFGDVWLCSGQGNMALTISGTIDPTTEIEKAKQYSNLRLMQVQRNVSENEEKELLADVSIPWSAPSDANVPSFSAVCLMYAERMSDSLGNRRPIGLIDSTYTGTPIQCWISARVTDICGSYASSRCSENSIWNAMIYPLTKISIRGVIWWQGESDIGSVTEDYTRYTCMLSKLISDWRNTFVDGNVSVPFENNVKFPFGIVQLGAIGSCNHDYVGRIRWNQTQGFGYLPNVDAPETFMASAYDTYYDDGSIYLDTSKYKDIVAERLSQAAKYLLWDETYLPYGPKPVSISDVSNNAVVITYDSDLTVNVTKPGFTVLTPSGWIHADILFSSTRDVTVDIDPTATELSFAFNCTVCFEYLGCAIYKNDVQRLPALPWIWTLNRP